MIVGDMEIRLRADIARLQADMTQARRVVGDAAGGISRAADQMKAALAAIGLGAGLAQIIQMSDQYTKFTSQLRLATLSQREYAHAFADVKRISTDAQSSMADTGTLYARVANGTRELGTTQKQVANVTETVSLALKVSGATAVESASAMLQLSQSFASGTLRGEEFNAVNEAAPRLMKALADGMGVPVGALKEMASNGLITSKIMAETLPKALLSLREEAKQIQTISGAFQVLKDRVMEYTAVHAQANGTVAGLTMGISLLANNLDILMGAVTTLTAAKLSLWMKTWVLDTYGAMAANRALAASTLAGAVTAAEAGAVITAAKLAEATATAEATGAAVVHTAARVAELRAVIAAAEGDVALALALNGLIPAEARAAAAAEVHAVSLAAVSVAGANAARTAAVVNTALTAQAAAATLAARAMGVLRGIMGFFGGPLGLIITLLGAAAVAWQHFSSKAKEEAASAATAVSESTTEMISRLDKQIEKLKERNAIRDAVPVAKGASDADVDGIARAKAAMEAAQQGTGRFSGRSEAGLALARANLTKDYEVALKRVEEAQRLVTEAAKGTRDTQIKAWYAENGTGAQKLAAELEKLKKQFGTIPPEMEALTRKKFEGAESKSAETAAAAARKAALDASIEGTQAQIEKEKALRSEGLASAAEMNRQGLVSDAAFYAARVAAALAGGQDIARVKVTEIAELKAYNGKDVAERISTQGKIDKLDAERNEALRAAAVAAAMLRTQYAYDKDAPHRAADDATKKEVADIYEQIAAMEQLVRAYNMLPAAMTGAAIADLEAQKVALSGFDGNEKAVDGINQKIAALQRLQVVQGQLTLLDTGSDVTKAKELLDILSAVDEAAKEAATGMGNTFGTVGTAIGALTTAMSGYAKAQAAIAAELAAAKDAAKGDETKIARANAAAAQQGAQLQVKSYGDMASAANGFFKENTAGYKVLQGAEKAFRAYEMAMALQSMVKKIFFKEGEVAANVALNGVKLAGEATTTAASTGLAATEASAWGITAVVKALASLPFPANLAAGAATLAAVVAIGAAMVGGIGGGGADVAKQRQEASGTGSVLGDKSAKSESMSNALDLVADNTYRDMTISSSMLASLRNIESSLGGLGNLITRTDGVSAAADSVATGHSISAAYNLVPVIGQIITLGSKLPGGAIINKLFGATTSVVDEGITAMKSSLANVEAFGLDAQSYATVNTKKKFFGVTTSNKTKDRTVGLSDELNNQLTLVITGMATGIKAAAGVLGLGGDAFNARLNAFVVDLGKISLKGLTGDQLQDALETAFSKLGDDMAKFAIGGLDQFQQVGEGAYETLIRIANDYATVDAVLGSFGKSFGAVGLASVAAREQLIAMSGGLDKFTSQGSFFLENFFTDAEKASTLRSAVNAQLTPLNGGVEVKTIEQFKQLALSQDLTTTAGQATYTTMMGLAEAFKQMTEYGDASGKAIKSAQAILDERNSLQDKYDEMSMTSAQLRAKERLAIDASNVALFDLITARQDEIAATTKAEAVVTAAYSALQRSAAAQKTALADAYKVSSDALKTLISDTGASITKLSSLSSALKNSLNGMSAPGSESASRAGAQAQLVTALAIARAGGALPSAESLQTALSKVTQPATAMFGSFEAYQKDFYQTALTISGLSELTDSTASIQQRTLDALNAQSNTLDATYASEVARLDKLVDWGKAQVDAMNGVDTSVQSLGAAIYALGSALGGVGITAKMPGFAAGGNHAGGWRIVGENGPEAEYTGPSSISSSSKTRQMLDNSGLEERMDDMNRTLKAALYQIAKNTGKTADKLDVLDDWDRNGLPAHEASV